MMLISNSGSAIAAIEVTIPENNPEQFILVGARGGVLF